MPNPIKSQKRSHITDYLGGSTVAPLMMSDERWSRVKENFKIHDQICPVCKKTFSPPNLNDWVYKTNKQMFCSWTCLRKHEKAEEAKKAKRKK